MPNLGATPVSSALPVASREIVLSKSSLMGICLIAFACGIVTTAMADRARTRTSEREALARETEPATATAPVPVRTAPEPTLPTAPAVAVPASALPTQAAPAPAPASPTQPAPTPADPVVVQMPNLGETSKARPPTLPRASAPAASRVAIRQRAVATATPAKKMKAANTGQTVPPSAWVDPFSE